MKEVKKNRILVATPLIMPEVTSFYCDGMLDMFARPPQHTTLTRVHAFPRDIVRARSRLLRQFVAKKEFTHVLYVDGDNVPSTEALQGMLRADKDVVACPYPRREFHPLNRPHDINSAMRYSILKMPGAKYDANKSIVQIMGIGFGFTLITRTAAEKLIEDHRWKVSEAAIAAVRTLPADDQKEILDQLSNVFEDDFPGNDDAETVAVFSLYNQQGNKPTTLKMLGEDYSFCARCRDSGIGVWLYVGKGAPVEHDGLVRFTGNVSDIIKCAEEPDQ
jgi:hypothetical protein